MVKTRILKGDREEYGEGGREGERKGRKERW